jgi:hypothetical protein
MNNTPCKASLDLAHHILIEDVSEKRLNAEQDQADYELELSKVLTNPDVIWEAIGPDAIRNNDECNRIAIELADLVMRGKEKEVGKLVCDFAKPYLVLCANIRAGLEGRT